MPLTAGTRLGSYEILGPLGAGGMGEVYRARDSKLNREVAIKVINPRLAGAENALRRFAQEARTVAQLSSPHVVHIYEFDPLAPQPYLAMECVRGASLQQLIRGQGAMDFATVADCARPGAARCPSSSVPPAAACCCAWPLTPSSPATAATAGHRCTPCRSP